MEEQNRTRMLMIRRIFPFALCLLLAISGTGWSQPAAKEFTMAFYNVENLFDTVNDPAKDDGEFTPEGAYRWTEEKYRIKADNIARVISELGADVVGLAEVENDGVMADLTEAVRARGTDYHYIHFESPDKRGIDVALMYKPSQWVLAGMEPLPVRSGRGRPSRSLLHLHGVWKGTDTHVLVCHLPSALTTRKRKTEAAKSIRYYADSIALSDPATRIILMGDFNCSPDSPLMRIITGRRGEYEFVFHNPFIELYRKGYGTYRFRGKWNMLDGILIGHTRDFPAERTGMEPVVFVKDYLITPHGTYEGYPYRSFSGREFTGGYSDHLPVYLRLQED